MIKNTVLLTTLVCVFALTSCSRGVVTTVDKSVNYQNAKSLPSLIKEPASGIDSKSRFIKFDDQQNITASIVTDKKSVTRLLVKAKPEAAWLYLDAALEKANVTIYNRNEQAGVFSVGCGGVIPPFEEPKRRGWNPLKRKKKIINTEYCVLKAEAGRRKTTIVSLLNRKGDPIKDNYTTELFERILNN